MLNHALFFHNLSRQIFCEIFVKIENTEYLSNQLTYANFDLAMMFPIKNWTFEQILVFLISEMYLACPTTTVKSSVTYLEKQIMLQSAYCSYGLTPSQRT